MCRIVKNLVSWLHNHPLIFGLVSFSNWCSIVMTNRWLVTCLARVSVRLWFWICTSILLYFQHFCFTVLPDFADCVSKSANCTSIIFSSCFLLNCVLFGPFHSAAFMTTFRVIENLIPATFFPRRLFCVVIGFASFGSAAAVRGRAGRVQRAAARWLQRLQSASGQILH